jgi:hypothetical protein
MNENRPQIRINLKAISLLLALWGVSGYATAQPADTPEPSVVTQQAAELKLYKQRFRVTANVVCQVHPKRPTFCKAYVEDLISDVIHPEMILQYSGLMLNEKSYAAETLPEGNFQFRTERVNLSGMKELEVDVIYVK